MLRDQAGSFDPQLIAKYQRLYPGFDDKLTSIYARGMSGRKHIAHVWLALRERVGFERAAVAVARKLAVTMHAMLRSGEMFDRTAEVRA